MSGGLRFWGPLSALGVPLAALVVILDQLHKWWMLGPFAIAERQPVRLAPFLDLVLVRNYGISYGWFQQHGEAGRWALVALSLLATAALLAWLARVERPLAAAALGLIVGGALGNAIDRVVHGFVADFFLLHAFGFSWYVFNLADVAIVAAVGLLLYDSWAIGGENRREGA